MPFGLRAADAPILLGLAHGDRRLFMRLGNLMQHHRSCTEAVLAECEHEAGLRHLLLDRQLNEIAVEGFPELVARHGCEEIGLVLFEDGSGAEPWLVLALSDELNNPLLTAEPAKHRQADWHAPVSELLPSLHATVRKPVESLLAAQADDQRAAALEQLRYAAPPLTVVGELMPLLLADGADVVRERAIALLVAVGVHPLVVDLMRALQRGDDQTVARLAGQLPQDLPVAQTELLLAALITVLGIGQVGAGLIALATRMAHPLAAHRGLDRFLELLCAHSGTHTITGCIRALQEYDPQAVDRVLRAMLGQNPTLDARLIVLLAVPGCGHDPDLLRRGVSLLLSASEEPSERMPLAHALRRLDRDHLLARELVEQRQLLAATRDSTVFWLLADLARDGVISPDDGDTLTAAIAQVLASGQGPHLVAILDQQLPSLLPCSDAQRAGLVEPLAELVVRFRDDRSLDLIEFILSHMGAPACEPLWLLLDEHPQVRVRATAARVLARLLAEVEASQRGVIVSRLLAAAAADDQHDGRIACVTAAAELLAPLDLDPEGLCAEVDQRCEIYGIQAIEAQALLAASSLIDPERRAAILDKMLRLLTAELPETSTSEERDSATEEVTFVLDAQLGTHTDLVPRILTGLHTLAVSPHLPPPMLRRIVQTLIELWRKVASWELVWGPGNIAELARQMAAIGQSPRCPNPLRKQIVTNLLPRCTQLTIAKVLVLVMAAGEGESMVEAAGTCCQRLIRSCSRNEFADDEMTDLLEVFSGLLALPKLGEADARLRSQLVSLITSNRQWAGKRCRDRLRFLREELPEHLGKRLDWV